MNRIGSLLAIAGLALAAALFAHENFRGIVELVIAAGPGLIVASLFHAFPMLLNARAWQRLLPAATRPSLRVMTWATWIRESVNGLLPVGRIGGEIVAYRMVFRLPMHGVDVVASLIADMTLSMLTQAAFCVLGLAVMLLIAQAPAVTTQLIVGVSVALVLGVFLVWVQHAGALGAMTRMLDRLVTNRLRSVVSGSLHLDTSLRALYARRSDVGACLAWQLAGWVLGAGEIWLALHFLGQQRSALDAIVIEALIQAISSAAFAIPGALGVQEGGFLVVGAVLGIDGTTALALATARRLRDLIVFFPGLIAWQRAEARSEPSSLTESR
jgi:glycosyltransferase 2 family protein